MSEFETFQSLKMTDNNFVMEDLNNMCRLCLSTSSLISIFDHRLESEGSMQEIVEITTGVKISPSDEISHMLCSKCCNLTIGMYKFRNTSMLNDIELKEKAAKRKTIHQSVQDLFKKEPKLRIPPSVHICDISPVIVINKSKTDNLKIRMRSKKRKKPQHQKPDNITHNDETIEDKDSKKFKAADDPVPCSIETTTEQSRTHVQDQKQEHEELPLFSIKTVTKSFICEVCNKVYYSTRELNKHKSTHMHCALCRTSFESMEETKQHETCCSIKSIMSNQPKVFIKRCDEIEELRQKYSDTFRNISIVEISDDEDESVLIVPLEQTCKSIEQSKNKLDNFTGSKISCDGAEESGKSQIIPSFQNRNPTLNLKKFKKISIPEGNCTLGELEENDSVTHKNSCISVPSTNTTHLRMFRRKSINKDSEDRSESVNSILDENSEIFDLEISNPEKNSDNATLKMPVINSSADGCENTSSSISPKQNDDLLKIDECSQVILYMGDLYPEDDVGKTKTTENVLDAPELSNQESNPISDQPNDPETSNFNKSESIEKLHTSEGENAGNLNVTNSLDVGNSKLSIGKSHMEYSKTISNFVPGSEKPKENVPSDIYDNCEVISLLDDSENELHSVLDQELNKPGKLATKSNKIGSGTIILLHNSVNVLDIGNHTEKSDVTDNSKTSKEPTNSEKKRFSGNSKEMPSINKSENRNLKRTIGEKNTLSKSPKKLKTCDSLNKKITIQQSLNNNKKIDLVVNKSMSSNDNSFKPDITFVDENKFEMEDVDDENAYLENLLNSIKRNKSQVRQAVQTNSPSNSDILSIGADEFLYELNNLRGYLTYSQIPVNISHSKAPSIKYTFEPSSLMRNQKKIKKPTYKKPNASVEEECNVLVYMKQMEQVSEISESEPNSKKREEDTLNVPMQIDCATTEISNSSTINNDNLDKNDHLIVRNYNESLDNVNQNQTIDNAKNIEISIDISSPHVTCNNNSEQSDNVASNGQVPHLLPSSINANSAPSTTTPNCLPGKMTNHGNIISPQIINMSNPILSNTFVSYSVNNLAVQNTMTTQPQFYLVKNSNPNGIVSAPMTMIATTPLLSNNSQAFCTNNMLTIGNDKYSLKTSSTNLPYTQSHPVPSSNAQKFRSNNASTNTSSANVPPSKSRVSLLPPPMRQIRRKPPPPLLSAMQTLAPATSEAQKIIAIEKNISKVPNKSQNCRSILISHTATIAHAIQKNPSDQVFVAPQAPPKNRISLPKIRILHRKVIEQIPEVTEDLSMCDKLEANEKKEETSIQNESASTSAKYIRVKNLADLR